MRGTTMMVGAVAMTVMLGAASLAFAQSNGTSGDTATKAPDAGMNGKVIGAGSGSAQGAAGGNLVSTGQGGVAGTGLGKMPADTTMGTGQSVKGPPGQGISNSTDTAK